MTLVSICIPVYNGERFIERALESCIGQTYRNLEIVVSDNASTDNTRPIVERFISRDSRVKYFRNETNLGLARNILKSYEHASGLFVQHLSHDDWLDKNFVEEKVRLFEKHPDAAFVMSRLDDYRQSDRNELLFSKRGTIRPGIYPSSCLFRNFYRKPGLLGISAMARRNDVLKHFSWEIPNPYGYDPYYEKGIAIDNLFLLRILTDYNLMACTDKTAYNALSHPSNESKQYGFNESLDDRIKFFHITRIGFEDFFRKYAKTELSNYRVFSGSDLLVTVLFEIFRFRGRHTATALRQFFDGYSREEKRAAIVGIIPLALKRIARYFRTSLNIR